jgi:predicted homoserine dehydrogenase-like protein
MNLETIFGSSKASPVRAGLVGAGEFGATFLMQARHSPGLSTPVVCDLDVERARDALTQTGVAREDISACSTRAAALAALEAGRTVGVRVPTSQVKIMEMDLRAAMSKRKDILAWWQSKLGVN